MHLLNNLPLLCLIIAYSARILEAMAPGYNLQTKDQMKEKYDDTAGWIGQFSSDDCSGSPATSFEPWKAPTCFGPRSYCIAGVSPDIIPNKCIPWYPVLPETAGPSVGVTFGSGANKTTAIQFFEPVGNCHSDADTDPLDQQMPSCCDESQGGYLGTIYEAPNKDVLSDFGASKFGIKEGKCAKIGLQPNANQTLWPMRFFKGIQ